MKNPAPKNLKLRIPRFFSSYPLSESTEVSLPIETVVHAIKALRLRENNKIMLFSGNGVEFEGVIKEVGTKQVIVTIGKSIVRSVESPIDIILAQSLSRGDRMDYSIQKATELGANTVQPLQTERSMLKLDSARQIKRVQHWQKIAISACEQCGRNTIPTINPPLKLSAWLNTLTLGADSHEKRLALVPDLDSMDRTGEPPKKITILIGPEGGFSQREIANIQNKNFSTIKLGPRILRTETACSAAISMLQSIWGDF